MPVTMPLSPGLPALARQVGLPVEVIEYFIKAGLINQPVSPYDLVELRRIRRLRELEVNPAGIEIILHMRRRIAAMHAEMEAMAAKIADLQTRFKQEWPAFEPFRIDDI